MKEINYYEYIRDHLENRPFNDRRHEDGNRNYIHQTDAWTIVRELNRLRIKIKELEGNNEQPNQQEMEDS